jgi:hypothetical protein
MEHFDTGSLPWRKSRASATGNCVEAAAAGDAVFLRDSKDREGPLLRFTTPEWEAFLTGVKSGEFEVRQLERPWLPPHRS